MIFSPPVKLIVGALTLLPIVHMVYFFVSVMSSLGARHGGLDDLDLLFRLHLGTMLLTFVLMIFYIVFLFRTSRVPQCQTACNTFQIRGGNSVQ